MKYFSILFLLLFSFTLDSGEVISLRGEKVRKIRERKTQVKPEHRVGGEGGQVLYWMGSAYNMQSFLENQAKSMAAEESGQTLLHMAAQSNRTDLVTYLLESGQFDVDARDSNGNTALILAAAFDNPEMIRLLIEYGADKNAAEDINRNTALHQSAFFRHVNNVKELLVARADINATNKEGNTPLHMVSLSDFMEQYLQREESDIVLEAQLEAEEEKYSKRGIEVMEWLLMGRSAKVVNAQNKNKNTVLHLSTEGDDPRFVEYLLFQALSDPGIENVLGETAESKARLEGNYEAVQIFSKYNKLLEEGEVREGLPTSSQDKISKDPCQY